MIKHVAFIMDGNRRWAREKGLPTLTGHAKGYKKIEPLIQYAQRRGIPYLTFWAFSTENWKRDKKEVSYLMDLFRKLFKSSLIKRLIANGGKIRILGELAPFPEDIQKSIKKLVADSQQNTAINITIALNYGGRAELIHAVQKIISDKLKKEDITEEIISQHLYTSGQPDPDLIIRTGGEQRLSGYLPWQSIYSELYFTEIYWPDFDEKAFDKALETYEKRNRRFGE